MNSIQTGHGQSEVVAHGVLLSFEEAKSSTLRFGAGNYGTHNAFRAAGSFKLRCVGLRLEIWSWPRSCPCAKVYLRSDSFYNLSGDQSKFLQNHSNSNTTVFHEIHIEIQNSQIRHRLRSRNQATRWLVVLNSDPFQQVHCSLIYQNRLRRSFSQRS